MTTSNPIDRRTVLGASAGTLGLMVAGSAAPFASHASAAQTRRLAAGYGPLVRAGELLALPKGFSYTVLAGVRHDHRGRLPGGRRPGRDGRLPGS